MDYNYQQVIRSVLHVALAGSSFGGNVGSVVCWQGKGTEDLGGILTMRFERITIDPEKMGGAALYPRIAHSGHDGRRHGGRWDER